MAYPLDHPQVVALAGRRIDAPGSNVSRFSLSDVALVRERLRHQLNAARPEIVVCSAACGADLLALDEAARLGIRRRLILPFGVKDFREHSVIDRPGDWGTLFDHLISEAEQSGDLVILNNLISNDAYAAANRAILDQAQDLGRVNAWIVWDGRPREEGDLTLQFADEAFQREIPVYELLTLSAAAEATDVDYEHTCFVAMPFGIKPIDGRPVLFDTIYSTIFAPAIDNVRLPEGIALRAYRTDKDFSAALIDKEMFEHLEYSRFVVGDLTGLNPNVMFELGMRYRSREAGTALFRQPRTTLPFDITGVKVFEYDTTQPVLARRLITRVLQESAARNRLDSPIRRALRQRDLTVQGRVDVDALLKDAENALRTRDLSTARAKYTEAARLLPTDASILVRLATVEKSSGRWSEALTAAKRATEIAPEYAEAWRERGIAEAQLWRASTDRTALPDGASSLQQAVSLNPADFDARASLGGVLKRQQRHLEALAAYQESLRVSGGHPYPLLNVVKLEAKLHGLLDLSKYAEDLVLAARLRERQVVSTPPADSPWCFFDLAEIRLYQGRADDALGLLNDGIRCCDDLGKLSVFRDTLFELRSNGVKIEGLDRMIARADQELSR